MNDPQWFTIAAAYLTVSPLHTHSLSVVELNSGNLEVVCRLAGASCRLYSVQILTCKDKQLLSHVVLRTSMSVREFHMPDELGMNAPLAASLRSRFCRSDVVWNSVPVPALLRSLLSRVAVQWVKLDLRNETCWCSFQHLLLRQPQQLLTKSNLSRVYYAWHIRDVQGRSSAGDDAELVAKVANAVKHATGSAPFDELVSSLCDASKFVSRRAIQGNTYVHIAAALPAESPGHASEPAQHLALCLLVSSDSHVRAGHRATRPSRRGWGRAAL